MENSVEKKIAGEFPAIGGVNPFDLDVVYRVDGMLRRSPDGVYHIQGRVIPVRDNAALGVDNGQPVVGIHDGKDVCMGLLGSQVSVDVKEG